MGLKGIRFKILTFKFLHASFNKNKNNTYSGSSSGGGGSNNNNA